MRFLLARQPDLLKGTNSNGDTALTLAARFSTPNCLEILLDEFKMDINKTGVSGLNCLLNAIFSGNIENLRFLFARKPDLLNQKCRIHEHLVHTALSFAATFAN